MRIARRTRKGNIIMHKTNYAIKARPTRYGGINFRSRLEARWAAFFDLIKVNWEYEPIDLDCWSPDFRLELPCYHSECRLAFEKTKHILLVEVKPYDCIEDFDGHPCMNYPYGTCHETGLSIPADASAAFGIHPSITYWEMAHGSGGGDFSLYDWGIDNQEWAWKEAGNIVQYKPGLAAGNNNHLAE